MRQVRCGHGWRVANVVTEHLQEFMSGNVAVSEKLVNAFVNLQCTLARPLETQTTKDPKDSKKTPMTTLRPTYMCLQCSTVSTVEDRDAHCEARKHQLCKCAFVGMGHPDSR